MIKDNRAQKLRSAGIDSVEALWKADLSLLETHPEFENDLGFVRKQLPLLQGFAQAHATGQAVVFAEDPRIFDLNEPIIHMDLEFDGPASQIFLYGMLDHHTREVTSWFETSRRGQEKLLRDFRALCKDQNPTMMSWGGDTSDSVQLRRASEKYGISPGWVNEVNWFDLQNQVIYTGSAETQRVYLPVKRFKSEKVAEFFGYKKPPLKVKDGYHALRLYRSYRRSENPQIRKDLIEYNAEDLHHTRIILDGLRDLMS